MSRPVELFSKSSESLKLLNAASSQAENYAVDRDCSWKKELANATTSAAELLEQLNLTHHIKTADIRPDFKCLVTASYINKMQPGNIDDPLLQQVLPLARENDNHIQHGGMLDPVGDMGALASTGLLHKYHGRALLISTGACAIHCRYCFRRAYPYQSSSCTGKALDDTLGYLNDHSEIEEIILSGGDPLTLDNEKLANLISRLESVSHIQTLRLHTRLPVVLPSRINTTLIRLLQSSRFHIVLVIHSNHASELQKDEQHKLQLLHEAGISLLNQSVLLKGINDNVAALVALSKRLFQCKTLPYYLHLLDPVKGAMHFDVSKKTALHLKHQIEQQLPGYLVPRLVQEIAGNKAKSAIFRI
ncbi:MAG: EF-P beta-lysylation protein EpmB [Gammaproteobacteria bacterium]